MTTETCLRFSKPCSLAEFTKQPEADLPGVYIWGYEENGYFIPYYVGESTTSVKMRVLKHKADILKDTSTYRRLKASYSNFYMDPGFPVYVEIPKGHNAAHLKMREMKHGLPEATPLNDEEWFKNREHFLNSVYYYNHKEFFPGSLNLKEFSIQNLPVTRLQEDVLRVMLEQNHFKVKYWTVPATATPEENIAILTQDLLDLQHKAADEGIQPKDQKRWVMEVFEALTKYSLKGKTGSTSISITELKKRWAKLGMDPSLSVCSDEVLASTVISDLKYHNFSTGQVDPYDLKG
jgi:hypothetical protein